MASAPLLETELVSRMPECESVQFLPGKSFSNLRVNALDEKFSTSVSNLSYLAWIDFLFNLGCIDCNQNLRIDFGKGILDFDSKSESAMVSEFGAKKFNRSDLSDLFPNLAWIPPLGFTRGPVFPALPIVMSPSVRISGSLGQYPGCNWRNQLPTLSGHESYFPINFALTIPINFGLSIQADSVMGLASSGGFDFRIVSRSHQTVDWFL